MKISEYRLLEQAFENSFGFMLNRIEEEIGPIKGRDDTSTPHAIDKCFNEFVIALEEMGVELGEAEVAQG